MNNKELKFSKIRDVKTPLYSTTDSAGIDFFIPSDLGPYTLNSGESALIPSGIKVDLTDGYCLIAFNKSGIVSKKYLMCGAVLIDPGYMGEIFINVINVGREQQILNP